MTSPVTPGNNMDQTDYMRLFMQELMYQDPMKPVDNKEFMAQMAQFSSLQQNQITNELLDNLMQLQVANQNIELLGKKVRVIGSEREGYVSKINFSESAPPSLTVTLTGSSSSGFGEELRVNLKEISEVSLGSVNKFYSDENVANRLPG